MIDIQSQKDTRGISLNQVGIKHIATPFYVQGRNKNKQPVIAYVDLFADLDSDAKGHHLSRFAEILHSRNRKILSPKSMRSIVSGAKDKLNSNQIHLEASFVYLGKKTSPVSQKNGFIDYECSFICDLRDQQIENKISISVPVLLLCPCSKAISKYNAHNQRAIFRTTVEFTDKLFIEDLVEIIENEASSEVYPILKRVDEKFVTENSYNNPRFVEDIVRNVALKFEKRGFKEYILECESFESIHNHNAYAKYMNIS